MLYKTLSSRTQSATVKTRRNELTAAEEALIAKEVDMIAGELRLWLPDDERRAIKRTPKADLAKFSSCLGRAIRNEYDLWLEDHHITKIYLEAEAKFPLPTDGATSVEVDAGDGRKITVSSNMPIIVDDHPCHPDNFSARCIERLWEIIQ